MGEAEGVDEGPGAPGHHDELVVLDAGPVDGPTLDDIDLQNHVHGGFQPASVQLPVSLAGMSEGIFRIISSW